MNKIERKTHTLDAAGQSAGRLASRIAIILRGKNKASYQPHLDEGDIVRVINIKNLKFTGKKLEQKKYYSYSGYPGGLKTKKIINLALPAVLKNAVKQMLPANKHRVSLLKRLIIN